tara:strand:- start:139 stop:255 length:117 start_codon:yes stop_codon:yes gene_type:complete
MTALSMGVSGVTDIAGEKRFSHNKAHNNPTSMTTEEGR